MRSASAAFLLLVCLLVEPAGAAAPVAAGWWTSAPLGPPPDVPPDGLLVQGGPAPNEPIAYAALSFSLAPDERPRALTLTVAAMSASTPSATIALCLLSEPFTPAQGGPMADAPTFDCADVVVASPSADGDRYEFDVSALGGEGELGVAVLPTASTDRVVLSAPSATALRSAVARPAPAATTAPVAAPDGGGAPGAVTPAGTSVSAGATPVRLPVASSAPGSDASSGSGGAGRAAGAAPGQRTASPATSRAATVGRPTGAGGAGATAPSVVGFLALALLASALWLSAGRLRHPDANRF